MPKYYAKQDFCIFRRQNSLPIFESRAGDFSPKIIPEQRLGQFPNNWPGS
jgi:hypothetical protein